MCVVLFVGFGEGVVGVDDDVDGVFFLELCVGCRDGEGCCGVFVRVDVFEFG